MMPLSPVFYHCLVFYNTPMFKIGRIVFVLLLILLGVWLVYQVASHRAPAVTPTVTLTSSPIPSHTPTPTDTPTITPTFSPTPLPPILTPSLDVTVQFHPDGGLYVGDWVSMEVIAPHQNADTPISQVVVTGSQGETIGSADFGDYGIVPRRQATMIWTWDTHDLQPGNYSLLFTFQPGGITWTETVALLPADDLPFPEPAAHWAVARSHCCVLNYVTSTEAERDLAELLEIADQQADHATQTMGIAFTSPITVTLLPRLLGHGGFSSNEVNISYLDRNYAGSNFGMVLHHEMVHTLDARLGGKLRPSLFVEGLAVYKTGGHFKPELLLPRAAALLDTADGLAWYIPLAELADQFYSSQHDIGYLEGAALIDYMVSTWGEAQFFTFYRDIVSIEGGSQSQAIDQALQKHYGFTFYTLEQSFIQALRRQVVTPQIRDDLRLTVVYYDAVRRYQQDLDPSAFFQTAWLLDTLEMQRRGIVADYVRHPSSPENLALETMLVAAYDNLSAGNYPGCEQILHAVNAVLDAIESGVVQPFEITSLARDYYAIVVILSEAGYQAQHIIVEGGIAHTWASAGAPRLVDIEMVQTEGSWKIKKPGGG
jgi:hypothetical protein